MLEFLGVLVISILAVILDGFTFTALWGWFIVSAFGLAKLTIVQGIGVAMTVRYLTKQGNLKKEKEFTFWESVVVEFGTCGTVLLIGYIIFLFI
jgi:hypothetical protein